MDTILLARIEAAISKERMRTYRNVCTTDEEVIVQYFWNQALAESPYSSLGYLEISLRNAIHTTMTARTGTERWIPTVLPPNALRDHYVTMASIAKKYGPGHTIGQMVASLTFGKWVHMLKVPGCQWVSQRPYPIFSVFPNYPTRFSGDRETIHEHLHYVLELRNRVMHHEPIFGDIRVPNKAPKPITKVHEDILEAIGWIDDDLRKTAVHVDRFDEIFQNGKAAITAELPKRYDTL